MKNVLVIGGGAAGLMSAISASESGASVTVLEAGERTGRKLLVTGNGKCNFTNRHMTAECFHSEQPEKIMPFLSQFGVEETVRFFRKLGILVRDKGGYLYPRSEQAASVWAALFARAKELSVHFLYNQKVTDIRPETSGFQVSTSTSTFSAEAVILASGGIVAPKTGSDGRGLLLAERLGHRIIPVAPALVQLTATGFPFRKTSGVRTQARIQIYSEEVLLAEDTGEIQLTDYGLSGIPAFQVSRLAARAVAAKQEVKAVLDFFPELTSEELREELFLRRSLHPEWSSLLFLNGMLPDKLSNALLSAAGISLQDTWKAIPDRKIEKLLLQCKSLTVSITGTTGFLSAQVTAGGIPLDEIREGTCESLLVPGLYLAGEILDVDGICGGYNLQWAWTTGFLAGRAAAGGIEKDS